jgi:hypothetical protein
MGADNRTGRFALLLDHLYLATHYLYSLNRYVMAKITKINWQSVIPNVYENCGAAFPSFRL